MSGISGQQKVETGASFHSNASSVIKDSKPFRRLRRSGSSGGSCAQENRPGEDSESSMMQPPVNAGFSRMSTSDTEQAKQEAHLEGQMEAQKELNSNGEPPGK